MNKWVFLAIAAACLALCAASPVKRSSETAPEAVKSSRQDAGEVPAVVEAAVAAPAAPVAPVVAPAAPAASAEEDDDDDDDYDVGVGDDDDDDEDEDEEEDDDDDDYIERFFEDLLGDDDEDDEPVGAGGTLQAVAPPQLIGSAGGSGNAVPLAATSAPAPAPAPVNNEVVTTLEASVIPPESEGAVYEDEDDEVTSSGAEESEGSFEEDDGREPEVAASQPAAAAAPAAPAPAQEAAAEEDEDDDDDEEDLGVGDLAEDDDDDEDEDEDDDDEDEDEDEGGDEDDDDDDDYDTVASRARAMDLNASGRVPASLYVAKYNRYVDSIIDRIRKVLRKSFDPVNVRLHSTTRVKNNTNKNKVKTGPKTPKQSTSTLERQLQEESLLKAQMMSSEANVEEQQPRRRGGGGGSGHGGQQQRPNRPQNQNNNNNKTKNKGRNKPRAKATLMGLSSIRRDGDVSVNLMSSHTSVRSNFLLGPLILKVEKEFGRGETKELRSASAVTEEMSGTMALRISPEGIASLHSMKVLQPKQVRVESADDHDRTREFVWRRSSHIARLVSRKLAAAARSMLGTQKTDRMLAEEGKSLVQAQANLYASELGQSHS